ncbi:YjzC family protein [Bacillus sp. DNRA2]|uniref:YjzC family protein n=1 Tax=Bacillus sp. DNRA2 TaxID=2723053 RepID=UPI00145C4140|nr:YjzC family protein [Bacillus sp. DNRA2]NMD70806.1 YjzC family protein [Bacillus sp. DNRA2]
MGQNRQFKSGHKAPNNGVYIEIGDSGDQVNNPKMIRLKAGDKFPENSNDDRVWSYKRRP